MESSGYVGIAVTITLAILGFFWKAILDVKASITRVWAAIDMVKEKHDEHRVEVAKNYVTNDEVQAMRAEMREEFRGIRALLQDIKKGS